MTASVLPLAFNPAVRAGIVSALHQAYDEAAAIYAPDRGLGDRLHGWTVYEVLTHLFERDLAQIPGVYFARRRQGPEIDVGALRVRWNKVGRGEAGEDIQSSFPRGSRAAAFMAIANQQMRLWADPTDDSVEPTNWIICHLGNPRDGLRAVYLAAPIEVEGERVTGWRTATAIWSAADPLTEFPDAPPLGLPQPTDLPDLEIALLDEDRDAEATG
jgi:hypothetical protein